MYKDDTTVEDVMANIMMDNGDGHVDGYKEVAKEAKDIAIDFAMYAREEWRRFHEEQKHGVEISWIILWEKFINQRYE